MVWESEDICSEVCRSLSCEMMQSMLIVKGGMSFLSTQYGWAANNVANYEVVLANGSIVNANAKENTGKPISDDMQKSKKLTR